MLQVVALLTAVVTAGAATAPPSLDEFLASLTPKAQSEVQCPPSDKYCVPKYVFNQDVEEASVASTIAWADAWERAGAKALVIEFNTNGGSVDDGFLLAKRIEESAIPVHCIVDGAAYSMGAYLLQSCATRATTARSTLMLHDPAIGGNLHGDSSKFAGLANRLQALSRAMAHHVIHRMKCSMAQYYQHTAHGQQWWMDADDMLRWGAVDGIVSNVPGYMTQWHLHGKPPL